MTCSNCQHQNPPASRFCNHCGNRLLSETPSNTLDITAKEAQRRQLTVLFCDLVGSTPLSEQLDPEEYRQLIINYHQLAEKEIIRLGGYVAQYLGDGLLVYFGYPKGLEDAPKASVQAALAIVEAVHSANKKWTKEGKTNISIRIGIHVGLVVVDDHLALGDTVNIAARLEGLAPINGIVISGQLKKLVQGWFTLKSLGKHQLKGISKPRALFQVMGESGIRNRLELAKTRGLSPLVGREQEKDLLSQSWEKVKKGKGQFIIFNGEAGIGKSRLAEWMKSQILKEDGDGVRFLEINCSPYHENSAFFPLIELLEGFILHFEKADDEQTKINKLKDFLEDQGTNTSLHGPLLAELLSFKYDSTIPPFPPPVKKKKLLEALLLIIIENEAESLSLIKIEDLHWMDPSTLEWLGLLTERLADSPILLIGTSRPGFQPVWLTKSYVSLHDLHRLPEDQIETICHYQTGGKSFPSTVMQQIVQKTEGVPLFVEELSRMLIESDLFVERENSYELNGPLPPLAIPSTLQDSLIARLDTLSSTKELVQVGSVLGPEFSLDMLLAVTRRDRTALETDLAQLISAEILYKKSQTQHPTYHFKHALIRDAAYETLLKSRRQILHQRVVHVLQEQFGELVFKQPELLAHHLTKAGLTEKAATQWEKASQLASQRYANEEAIRHAKKGLELVEKLEDSQDIKLKKLSLLKQLSFSIMVSKGYGNMEGREVAKQVTVIAREHGRTEHLISALQDELAYTLHSGDYTSCMTRGEELLSLTEDKEELIFSHCCQLMGQASLYVGSYATAQQYLLKGIKIYKPEEHQSLDYMGHGNFKALLLNVYALPLHLLGYPDKAIAVSTEAENLANKSGNLLGIFLAVNWKALLYMCRHDYSAIVPIVKPALDLAETHENDFWKLMFSNYQLLAMALEGKVDPAQPYQLTKIFYQFLKNIHPFYLYHISKAYIRAGNLNKAEEILIEAFESQKLYAEGFAESELYRLKGELVLVKTANTSEAEKNFLQALEIAKSQSSQWYELLASKSLAQLWHSQEESQKAFDQLSKAYNSFSEGLDLGELQEAKDLLDAWIH